MALLTIISVFVLICAVPQRALGQGCNCAFDPDGTLCEAACTYYSYCENFQVVTVQCQEGEVVDIEVGGCNSTANVAPPCGVWRDCSNKADGYYANEDDNCFSYHYCLNGQFMSNNLCPTGCTRNATYLTMLI
ncbi:unnamed protein product [Owenia fusiformis]|uniref:Chitin-binding type-2 domain-containing protein n=1 Tax=Owenia fusiformis TaxID=6347 RepID=A0A8S4PKQ0_OWEFU|nr:unnamed protein product [Owenia fusiformis]